MHQGSATGRCPAELSTVTALKGKAARVEVVEDDGTYKYGSIMVKVNSRKELMKVGHGLI